ncbi:SH3 domain-containing protein [Devosia sp. 2618]|uniref:SH3 domain-containing protein n=1 Tax=Devosia sp. 2618 TaxID=3156454 RepID=UPI003393DE47
MKRTTRKMLLNFATGIAVAATAAVVFLPAAYAAPGVVTANVNVRSGPGTNYPVIDTARTGTRVDVQQCQGSWCYVTNNGRPGWVSATYLSAGQSGATPVNPTQPGLSFGFSTGPGGPTFNFGVGQPQVQPPIIVQPPVVRPPVQPPIVVQPPRPGPGPTQPPRPPRPPIIDPVPVAAEVCFYDQRGFRGPSFCLESGDNVANLNNWADRISSIENRSGLEVQVCTQSNYRGCRTYTTSSSQLGDYDDYIVSVRVR